MKSCTVASPLSSPASDAAIDPTVQANTVAPAVSGPATRGQRLHALDGLRAVALLLGLVLHSTMPYVLPPGLWAVGTNEPVRPLAWLAYYLHCFRLEVFFLLAGFFGALVVAKRGTAWWLKDRAVRILLVFLLALLPMKIALAAVWIWGGLVTAWLQIPEPFASLPLWRLALGALFEERWPAISITHLWFLYYLSILSAFWAAAHLLAGRLRVVAALATLGQDRKSTRLNSSHTVLSRMPSSA